MKRRDFIQTTCKYALLCASPIALTALQSCEDVDEYKGDGTAIPVDPPTDGDGSSDGSDDIPGGDGTYIKFDTSTSDFQSLNVIGGSIVTGSNAADPNGFLLYRSSDTTINAFSRKCTHAGSSIGAFVNGVSTCPNHRAQFNISGNVVGGPARSSLKKYNTSFSDNILKIFYTES